MTTGRINQVAIPSKIPNQGAGATARARAIVPLTLRVLKGLDHDLPSSRVVVVDVLPFFRTKHRGEIPPDFVGHDPPHLHHHLSGPISSFTMRGRVFPQVFPKRQSSPSLQVIPPPGLLRPQSAMRGRARKPRVTSFRRCRPIGTTATASRAQPLPSPLSGRRIRRGGKMNWEPSVPPLRSVSRPPEGGRPRHDAARRDAPRPLCPSEEGPNGIPSFFLSGSRAGTRPRPVTAKAGDPAALFSSPSDLNETQRHHATHRREQRCAARGRPGGARPRARSLAEPPPWPSPRPKFPSYSSRCAILARVSAQGIPRLVGPPPPSL